MIHFRSLWPCIPDYWCIWFSQSRPFVKNKIHEIRCSPGDFNCRSPQWWERDNENDEGKQFEPLTSDLGLHQLVSGPTHVIGQSKSCIDLILTDQPNLFIESGIHPSPCEQCHDQITNCWSALLVVFSKKKWKLIIPWSSSVRHAYR